MSKKTSQTKPLYVVVHKSKDILILLIIIFFISTVILTGTILIEPQNQIKTILSLASLILTSRSLYKGAKW